MNESELTPTTAQEAARSYLATQLADRAPESVQHLLTFHERPLAGEGEVHVLRFAIAPTEAACDGDEWHYVVVGETTSNYFPAYGLDPDDAYSVHIGTRYLLGTNAVGVDVGEAPADAEDNLRRVFAESAPDATLDQLELAALFRCDAGVMAIYRLQSGDQSFYALGADCPPGFHELTHLPAPVVLRLHLGKVIRQEAADEARQERRAQSRD